MICCGIDPGNLYLGIAKIEGDRLWLGTIRGKSQPPKTKKNPKPERLKHHVEAHEIAHAAMVALNLLDMTGESGTDFVLGVEASAMGRTGSAKDNLAAVRQAIFESLVRRIGLFQAATTFRLVSPASGKKALTTYAAADKMRMVAAAESLVAKRFPKALSLWRALASSGKERGGPMQEAAADALGIALYLESQEAPREQEADVAS